MTRYGWLVVGLVLLIATPPVWGETATDDPAFEVESDALPLPTPRPKRTRRPTGLEARRKLKAAGHAVKEGFERAGAAVDGAVQSTKDGIATILENTGESLRSAGRRVSGDSTGDRPPEAEEESQQTFDEGIREAEPPVPSAQPDATHRPLLERDLE